MVLTKILSRWIPRLPASVHRVASTGRPLHSASGSLRGGSLPLAQQQNFPAASTPTRRVCRFPRRYRHMASSSGVEGEHFRKPPSAKEFIISLGKHSATTQGMENIEDVDTTKVITRYSYVPPANSVEDETTASGDFMFSDEDASRTTLEVMDSKPDTSGEIVDITGSELSTVDKESWAAAEPDCDMEIFPNSSHRDGSIYRGTDDWKRIYCISDRNENSHGKIRKHS